MVLYAKIIICMAISLYTIPLVLHALGERDYGLYNLIAGIIALLAFMNGAMTLSTQRYLSVTIGEHSPEKLLQVYNQSILLHVLLGAGVVILIELLSPLLFSLHILNIPPEQVGTAYLLLHCMAASMFFTIMTVPLDAVLNAYENMLFFSLMGIAEAVLKLALALSLALLATGRLPVYGMGMALIAVLLFLGKLYYCHRSYPQLHISLRSCRNKALFSEIFGFAGWNMLSALAVVGRIQGLAIILNHFLGTIINAAYGIAIQVNGVMGYFSTTIQKSINPQLMESEGTHDASRQMDLTYALTKYSMLTLSVIALPLYLELPYIYHLWLGDIPEHSIAFTRAVIILSLITQASAGLMSLVQSTGHIKWYAITVSIALLSTLPLAYVIMSRHGSPEWVLWVACITEVVAVAIRFIFARQMKAIPLMLYLKRTILPNLLLIAIIGIVLWGCTLLMEPSLGRLLVVLTLDAVLFVPLSYYLVCTHGERTYLKNMIQKARKK
ncbi:MAG: hypothetical protein K5683_11645 [Prevotella sp.]|nr:hypothetical protein [Prevotella sp.]